MQITCDKCNFWKPPGGWDETWAVKAADCRRHPPVAVDPGNDGLYKNAQWPRTDPDDWCGDAEPITAETSEARRVAKEQSDNNPFAQLDRE